MPTFTDQMKTLTEAIRGGRADRSAAVARLQDHAEQVLSTAQAFMKRVSDDHQAMAREARSELAANRRGRSEEVHAFRAATRRDQRESRDRLRRLLDDNRAQRQECMGQMLHGFHEAQQRVAHDLHTAARLWHDLECRGASGK